VSAVPVRIGFVFAPRVPASPGARNAESFDWLRPALVANPVFGRGPFEKQHGPQR